MKKGLDTILSNISIELHTKGYHIMGWYNTIKLSQQANTITLYHGTTTGPNDQNIASFKAGIDLAKGENYTNQKPAFYGYPNFQGAADIARQRQSQYGGKKMVVQINAPIEFLELDYEHNYNIMAKLVAENWPLFQSCGMIQFDDRMIDPARSKLFPNRIMVQIDSTKITFSTDRRGEGDLRAADVFSKIIEAMVNRNPSFKQTINQVSLQNIKPNVAIKYIGGKIMPTAISVEENGNWVNV